MKAARLFNDIEFLSLLDLTPELTNKITTFMLNHKLVDLFDEAMLFTVLINQGQSNFDLDLERENYTYFCFVMRQINKQLKGETGAAINPNFGRQNKKSLVRAFKKFVRLGLIEILSSKSWRKHKVKINAV